MWPPGQLRSNWRLDRGGEGPHVDQAPLRQPPHPRELRPQISGEPADDLAPPPLRLLPVQDQTSDLPIQPDQLSVHRPRRLHPRRPDPNLDLLQELGAPHRLHSARPRRSAHPPILSHATAGRSGFRLSASASAVFAAHGLRPPLLASHLRRRGQRRCSRAYPTTCPAMSRPSARTVSVGGSGPQTHGFASGQNCVVGVYPRATLTLTTVIWCGESGPRIKDPTYTTPGDSPEASALGRRIEGPEITRKVSIANARR